MASIVIKVTRTYEIDEEALAAILFDSTTLDEIAENFDISTQSITIEKKGK